VTPLSLASELRGKVVVVEIEDPIGGFTYTVDTVGRMVHRVSLPAPGSRKAVRARGELVQRGSVSGYP